MAEFGTLLRLYRNRAKDPRSGRPLTQERLVEMVADETGITYSAGAVSEWERGKSQIHKDDRLVLVGIIQALYRSGGIRTVAEANQLLHAGHYRGLNAEERARVDSAWTQTETANDEATATGVDRVLPLPTGLKEILARWLGTSPAESLQLHPSTCGDRGLDLGQQRLHVTSAFGAYFAGLLEREENYLPLSGQIEFPAPEEQQALSPLERIFWALQYPKGPRLLIIAAEGGMGKSTLAAKIVRCLFEEQAVDMILGDSAKSRQADPVSGEVVDIAPGYYDLDTFYERLSQQLGLPAQGAGDQALAAIQDRLIGRRAIIVLDNLETVPAGERLLASLEQLATRDVRVLVTTRQVSSLPGDRRTVHLAPLTDIGEVARFAAWHIQRYGEQQPNLADLSADIGDPGNLRALVDKSGGIPLLIQFMLSDTARYSWDYVEKLPRLFGRELLDFLYRSRWQELERRGKQGRVARQLLQWVARQQEVLRRTTFTQIREWAAQQEQEEALQEALKLLYERFLLLNHDPQQGNFALFPSLVAFLHEQQEGNM